MKTKLIILSVSLLISCTKEPEVGVISTKFGDIVVDFFDDVAPKHVESFKILTSEGFYNGTTFHRLVPGFVIQGGDPFSKDDDRTNDGLGGRAGKYYGIGEEDNPDTWMLPAEFNDRSHIRGALSMARSNDPNSASSQFFICVADVVRLDHKYTVFGQVIQGLEVVDRIVNLPRGERDNPLERVEMNVTLIARSKAFK